MCFAPSFGAILPALVAAGPPECADRGWQPRYSEQSTCALEARPAELYLCILPVSDLSCRQKYTLGRGASV